jgi:hypothetical protein
MNIGQIMPDVGVIEVQHSCCRIVAIALFGDRQRDDPDCRIRHRGNHGFRIFRRDQNIAHDFDGPVAFVPSLFWVTTL